MLWIQQAEIEKGVWHTSSKCQIDSVSIGFEIHNFDDAFWFKTCGNATISHLSPLKSVCVYLFDAFNMFANVCITINHGIGLMQCIFRRTLFVCGKQSNCQVAKWRVERESERESGLNRQLHHNKSEQTMADVYQCQLLVLHEYFDWKHFC